MKRGKSKWVRTFFLCLLVLSVLFLSPLQNVLWFMPQITSVKADPTPSTVGTSTTVHAVTYPYQRKSFYANGRFWVFYSDGTNMVFRSSTGASSWSSATTVRACALGVRFSVFFDETYVHYVYHYDGASNNPLLYRRGTPNSNGTITWSAVEQTAKSGEATYYHYYPSISVDSAGYPWIGYTRTTGSPYGPTWVTKSSTNNGTWTTASGFPYQLTTDTYYKWTIPVPLTSEKVFVIYVRDNGNALGKLWNGTSWGSEETIASIDSATFTSAVNEGDHVHFAYRVAITYDIKHIKRTYGTGWGSTVTVEATNEANTAPVLSINTVNNDLYCFWMDYPTVDHVFYKKYSGGSWDASATDWITETTDDIQLGYLLSGFYQSYGSKIGLVYTTKTASPYNVRFDYLDVSVAPENSVTLNSPSSGATETSWSVDFKFNTTIYDGTIQNASLHITNTTTVPTAISWDTNHWNTTTVGNGTETTVNYGFSGNGEGSYKWNVEVFNSTTQSVWASSNFTLTVDIPPRYQNVNSNATSIVENGTILLYGQGYDGIGLDWAWLWTNETNSPTGKNYTEQLGISLEKWSAVNPFNLTGHDTGYGTVHPESLYFPTGEDGYKFWLYYEKGHNTTDADVYLVRSNNGTGWTETGITNPVAESHTYGGSHLADPDVVKIGSNWYLWTAGGDTGDGVCKGIWLFESTNGINWTSYGSEPVLNSSGIGFESERITTSSVWYNSSSSTFYMWYGGYNGSVWKLGLANSTDGKNWTKYEGNPVLAPDNGEGGVQHVNVAYQVALQTFRIYYPWYDYLYTATSSDGKTWDKGAYNPVLEVGTAGSWDDDKLYRSASLIDVHGNAVYISGSQLLYYSAYDGTYYDIGLARSPSYGMIDMNDVADAWSWSNFTWTNSSISAGTQIQWRIYYNDTYGNINGTSIHTFQISGALTTISTNSSTSLLTDLGRTSFFTKALAGVSLLPNILSRVGVFIKSVTSIMFDFSQISRTIYKIQQIPQTLSNIASLAQFSISVRDISQKIRHITTVSSLLEAFRRIGQTTQNLVATDIQSSFRKALSALSLIFTQLSFSKYLTKIINQMSLIDISLSRGWLNTVRTILQSNQITTTLQRFTIIGKELSQQTSVLSKTSSILSGLRNIQSFFYVKTSSTEYFIFLRQSPTRALIFSGIDLQFLFTKTTQATTFIFNQLTSQLISIRQLESLTKTFSTISREGIFFKSISQLFYTFATSTTSYIFERQATITITLLESLTGAPPYSTYSYPLSGIIKTLSTVSIHLTKQTIKLTDVLINLIKLTVTTPTEAIVVPQGSSWIPTWVTIIELADIRVRALWTPPTLMATIINLAFNRIPITVQYEIANKKTTVMMASITYYLVEVNENNLTNILVKSQTLIELQPETTVIEELTLEAPVTDSLIMEKNYAFIVMMEYDGEKTRELVRYVTVNRTNAYVQLVFLIGVIVIGIVLIKKREILKKMLKKEERRVKAVRRESSAERWT